MTMATVSEAGAAAFTSPDTAPAVATQTDAEEVNVTEETSETEADAFSDGDDGTGQRRGRQRLHAGFRRCHDHRRSGRDVRHGHGA